MIITIITEIIQAIHKAWAKRDAKRDLIAEVPQMLRRNKRTEMHVINNFTIHPDGHMTGFVDMMVLPTPAITKVTNSLGY